MFFFPRLVLMVADGLRADSFYSASASEDLPFLSEAASRHGAFGVAHTRVPTESRWVGTIAGHGPLEFWGLGGGLLHKVRTLLQWDPEAGGGGVLPLSCHQP